jgi:hypothetical protein
MKNETLNDKLLLLYKIPDIERDKLKKHFLHYSIDCGLCEDCKFRYEIIKEYESIFFKFLRTERRNHEIYKNAFRFIQEYYIMDEK